MSLQEIEKVPGIRGHAVHGPQNNCPVDGRGMHMKETGRPSRLDK